MYIRGQGVGDVIPVPMSDWGLISPCAMAAAQDAAAAGTSSSSSTLGTWAWVAIAGVAILAATRGKK